MKKTAEQLGIALWAAWMWALVLFLVLSAIIVRTAFLTFIDSHEIAYQYDRRNGETKVFNRSGYFFVIPFVTSVHSIDGRPMQVRIEANNRVLNAKLVRFRRSNDGVVQFVQMHGRKDYDDANLPEILKSYAYENFGDNYSKEALEKKYKFLEIMTPRSDGSNMPISYKDSINNK